MAMGCGKLVRLDLSYMVKAMGSGLASVRQCCPDLRFLSLAHCPGVQEWVMLRLFNGCGKLEELDLSYCTSLTDSALKAIGANCTTITRLQLRNCKQVSDAGLLPVCVSNSGMSYLDLAVDDLPFRISDVGLLAIGENCPEMTHLDLFGREKLTDVVRRPGALHWNPLFSPSSSSSLTTVPPDRRGCDVKKANQFYFVD